MPRLPHPNSWYTVAFSDDLPPGKVITRRLVGQDVVLYRTQSGLVRAIEPFCPHLGAHFGYGGTVESEELRCPFHGFRFDVDGACTATGYGTKPPPKARVQQWTVQENNGLIMLWFDSHDCPPEWEVPALDQENWSPLFRRTFPLKDHPQETVENGVDIGHFAIVHGYSGVEIQRDLIIDRSFFQVAYAAHRPMPVLGRFGAKVRFEFELSIHGLGFSMVSVHVPRFGIHTRMFVLATPTEDEKIDLHLALSIKKLENAASIHPALFFLPTGALSHLIGYIIHASLVNDAGQDFPIWENKRYLRTPALAEGDGPIGKFRQWTKQFYYDLETTFS